MGLLDGLKVGVAVDTGAVERAFPLQHNSIY